MREVIKNTGVQSLKKPKGPRAFNVHTFLDSAGLTRTIVEYRRPQKIYSQGDPATTVMYIQEGGVKLSVVSKAGKEAIVALLGPGDFFGEGCLAGLPFRMGIATAITPTTVLVIEKKEMIRVLHEEHKLSDRFIAYLLTRNIRVEEDLVDQLFNSIEKRLARDSVAARTLWQARPAAKDASEDISGDAGGNGRDNALPGQYVHE